MYSIVRFLSEDLVELVPQKWLRESQCWFPNMGALEKVKKMVDPSEESGSWYTVKVLANYDSYHKGRERIRKAEDTDDLEATDVEETRKRKRTAVVSSSLDSLSDIDEGSMSINNFFKNVPKPPPESPLLRRRSPLVKKRKNSKIVFVLKKCTPPTTKDRATISHSESEFSEKQFDSQTPPKQFNNRIRVLDSKAQKVLIDLLKSPGARRTTCVQEEPEVCSSSSMREMFNMLSRIEKKVDEILSSRSTPTASEKVLENLPIKTIDQFNSFDAMIGKDKILREKLESVLACAGGDCVRDFIFNSMKMLLAPELAKATSLPRECGPEKKLSMLKFDGTNCFKLLQNLGTRKLENIPNIRNAISDWLNKSKKRQPRMYDPSHPCSSLPPAASGMSFIIHPSPASNSPVPLQEFPNAGPLSSDSEMTFVVHPSPPSHSPVPHQECPNALSISSGPQSVPFKNGFLHRKGDFLFKKNVSKKSRHYFQCAEAKCSARLIYDEVEGTVEEIQLHNHSPNHKMLEKIQLFDELKTKARENRAVNPRRIFDSVLERYPLAAGTYTYERGKKIIQRARAENPTLHADITTIMAQPEMKNDIS